jgi:iron(III) transport system ATP-binding protein
LESANSGQVIINNEDCTFKPAKDRNFGIVFQSYALFPNMTVLKNVMFGLQQKKSLSKEEIKDRAIEVLRMVDLFEHKDKDPRQLSGGQQQRTALARAIALTPSYLLLDEPLSALDAKVRVKLRSEIKSIQKTLGITTIMVTHDQEEALTMADRIIVMNNAVVEQVGTPREIYDNPASSFVGGFIGAMNFFPNGTSLRAIRPEKLVPVVYSDPYDLTATINDIEFKGAMTRIYAVTVDNTEVCVDLPSERADELQLCENAMLFLRTPEDQMRVWAMA